MADSTTIDHLFGKLLARYGSAWRGKWNGIDPDVVKADWMQMLDGISLQSVLYAIQYLPEDFPPTAGQFLALCRRAPAPAQAQIDGPRTADPARVAAELKRAFAGAVERGPRAWIGELRARQEAGERLSIFQIECLENAERAPLPVEQRSGLNANELEHAKMVAARAFAQYERENPPGY